jgi:hypothetical protein
MEWESINMTTVLALKDTSTLDSSTKESLMELENLYTSQIKPIKKDMYSFKAFGKTDKKKGMESIFMELILRFTTKVTGRMTQKTVRDD